MPRAPFVSPPRLLSLALLAGALWPAPAAGQFEGVIHRRAIAVDRRALAEHDQALNEALLDSPVAKLLAHREALEADQAIEVVETTIYLSGHRMRVDAEGEQGHSYSIVDLEQGVSYFVLPDQQEYVELTKHDLNPTGTLADPQALNITTLGRTQRVAGFNATGYEVEGNALTIRVWVTNDRPALSTSFKQLTEALRAFTPGGDADPETVIGARYGFPVLIQRIDDEAYEVEEVTSIEAKGLPASLFAVPAGYTKRTMQELMAEPDGS